MKEFSIEMLKKKKHTLKIGVHARMDPGPLVLLDHEVRSFAALTKCTNKRDSATFVFVSRITVYIYSLISSELHLSVFGSETINSDKRSIYISNTL